MSDYNNGYNDGFKDTMVYVEIYKNMSSTWKNMYEAEVIRREVGAMGEREYDFIKGLLVGLISAIAFAVFFAFSFRL